MSNTCEVYDFDEKTPRNELLYIIFDLHDALKGKGGNHRKSFKETWIYKSKSISCMKNQR